MVKIREYIENDIEHILEINQIVWEISYKGLVSEEDLKERRKNLPYRLAKWRDNYSEVTGFVAEKDGKIIGSVTGRFNKESIEADCLLVSLYVLPEYQREGVGKALFDKFVDKMIKNGCKKIEVWTMFDGISNETGKRLPGPSMAFYEKMGCIKTNNIKEHPLGMRSIQYLKSI